MDCVAMTMAFNPLAQTLLTVVHTQVSGKPAKIAAWRAGAFFGHGILEVTIPVPLQH
jgi:hypothetical protein